MDSSGKIVWAKHNEIQSANLQTTDLANIKDGERIAVATKDLGNCEVYPQSLQHSPNGRFAVVCGDGEYIIYTALYGSIFCFTGRSIHKGITIFVVGPGATRALVLPWSLFGHRIAMSMSTNMIKSIVWFKSSLFKDTPSVRAPPKSKPSRPLKRNTS